MPPVSGKCHLRGIASVARVERSKCSVVPKLSNLSKRKKTTRRYLLGRGCVQPKPLSTPRHVYYLAIFVGYTTDAVAWYRWPNTISPRPDETGYDDRQMNHTWSLLQTPSPGSNYPLPKRQPRCTRTDPLHSRGIPLIRQVGG